MLHLDLFSAVYENSEFIFGEGYPAPLDETAGDDIDAWTSWVNFMIHTFRASDVTCQALLDHNSAEYTTEFVAHVRMSGACASTGSP